MNELRIASPCTASWDDMAGDARVRYCTLCSLNVYNFAEMTHDEIREILARTDGRVCGRIERRAGGTLRRRMSRVAAAVLAAVVSLPLFAIVRKQGSKDGPKDGSQVKLEIEQVAISQQPSFTGVVHMDGTKHPLQGVTVVLRNESTRGERTTVTDANGAFTIAPSADGLYRVEVKLEGFKPAVVEHLLLKSGQVTHARVAMRFDAAAVMMLGEIARPENLH